MGALPWFKFHSAAPTNIKVQTLRRRIGPEADAYLYRLWAYCARDMPSGRFEGEAADGLEMAIGWHGEPGALVAALVAVRLLDRDGAALVVHDWALEQGSHVSKFLKDRARANAKRRNPSANADELQCDQQSQEPPATVAGPSRDRLKTVAGPSRGASPISTLSVVSSKGVQGEDAPALVERMCAAFQAARHAPYALSHHDEAAMRRLLAMAAGSEEEILRRWGIALAWRNFPTCSSLAQLAQHWNHYAQPQSAPGPAPDVRRGVVRAEDAKHAPVGEVKL